MSKIKHGACTGGIRMAEYRVWDSMIGRCHSPSHRSFPGYGGRGIKVCGRWLKSFVAFFEDMGPRPSAKHSIDRIDNDGNYEPDNCRWATRKEQSRNRGNNRIIEIDGLQLTLAEAIERFAQVKASTVHSRLSLGWGERDALMRPVRWQHSEK